MSTIPNNAVVKGDISLGSLGKKSLLGLETDRDWEMEWEGQAEKGIEVVVAAKASRSSEVEENTNKMKRLMK